VQADSSREESRQDRSGMQLELQQTHNGTQGYARSSAATAEVASVMLAC
jgi:hypothetical protein